MGLPGRKAKLARDGSTGEQLLEVATRRRLDGVVSKRKMSPYRSGPSRNWRKIKTAGWREVNRER